MAIRKSKEETFFVKGNTEEWLKKIEQALLKGNFTNVQTNKVISQVTGNYKKLTVWGEISITVFTESDNVKIIAKSTANADNVFALFSSPNDKILSQFKNSL